MRRLLLLLAAAAAAITHAQSLPRILLFTATAPGAYRHSSIDTAVSTIQTLCEGRWEAIVSDDAAVMGQLQGYSVVVGVMNTDVDPPAVGPLLTASQAASLADYIERGGSFLGIHSAANCNYGVPWYGRLVGAFFDYHAPVQNVTVRALTREHESTRQWEGEVGIYEEMYHFRTDPRSLPSSATVLLTPASSYSDPGVNALGFRNGSEGTPQPLAWYREGSLLDVPAQGTLGGGLDDYQGGPSPRGGSGRSFYTSLGHDEGTWQMPVFQSHIAGAIEWLLASASLNSSTSASSSSTQPRGTTSGSGGGGGSSTAAAPASTTTGASSSAGTLMRATDARVLFIAALVAAWHACDS